MSGRRRSPRAVIFDVDGVVSPVHPTGTAWGDDVIAGSALGPVVVSAAMCARLDRLSQAPGVRCWWLTSWSPKMRARMSPFPGREWPVIAERDDALPSGGDVGRASRRTWWKLAALESWLDRHREIGAVAWCDDDLRGGRPAAVRRRFTARGVELLLVAPKEDVGLTPGDVERLEAWATRR